MRSAIRCWSPCNKPRSLGRNLWLARSRQDHGATGFPGHALRLLVGHFAGFDHDFKSASFHFRWLSDPNRAILCDALAAVWQCSGLVTALFLAVLSGVDDEVLKAAQVDGASLPWIYYRIVLPMMRPIAVLLAVAPGRGRRRGAARSAPGGCDVQVGYDHIDLAAARARGLVVTNTPEVLMDVTADLAFMLLLCACRRASEYAAIMRNGWRKRLGLKEMLGM